MEQEIYVRLIFTSSIRDPAQIIQSIGLQYDKSWRKGDKRSNSMIVECDHGCEIDSKSPKGSSIEQHMENLLQRVEAFTEKLSSLPEDISIEMSCSVYADEIPTLSLSRTLIKRISEINASLDIDLYVTS
jgi:hypothetical protein